MSQQIEYIILQEKVTHNLEAEVKKHIAQNWRPAGGMAVAAFREQGQSWDQLFFYQAMIRENRT